MWWCYTGRVKRVILTILSYYITLFGITSPFWYYITPFPVLPHSFDIIFTLFPYYLILLVLFSHFWSYYFTFFVLFPHFYPCYLTLLLSRVVLRILSISLSLRYCWQQQTQHSSWSNPKYRELDMHSSRLTINTVSKYFLEFEVMHTSMHRWIILRYQSFIFLVNVNVYCVWFM